MVWWGICAESNRSFYRLKSGLWTICHRKYGIIVSCVSWEPTFNVRNKYIERAFPGDTLALRRRFGKKTIGYDSEQTIPNSFQSSADDS